MRLRSLFIIGPLLGVALLVRGQTPGDVDGPPVAAHAAKPAAAPLTFQTLKRTSPDQHVFVARINLADPRISIHVAKGGPDPDGPGRWETVLRPTSLIARDNGFAVAINTVFFTHQSAAAGEVKKFPAGDPASANNLVIQGGQPVTAERDGWALWFDAAKRPKIGQVNGAVPDGAVVGAAGSRQIVQGGKNIAADMDRGRHPRTAAGIADGGKTLVLLVADGRRPGWAAGMSLEELADEMIAQGCSDAINFDGGGSSTMAARMPDGRVKVLNTPSDGSTFIVPLSIERPVPYVLGVKFKND